MFIGNDVKARISYYTQLQHIIYDIFCKGVSKHTKTYTSQSDDKEHKPIHPNTYNMHQKMIMKWKPGPKNWQYNINT